MVKNFKFSTQITIGYSIVLILTMVVGGVALVRLNQINSTFVKVNQWAVEQQLVGEVVAKLLQLRLHANQYILNQNQANLDRFNEIWTELEEVFFTKENVSSISNSTERAPLLEQFKQLIQEYKTHFEEIIQLIAQRDQIITEILDIQGPLAEDKLEQLRKQAFQANDGAGSYSVGNCQSAFLLMRINLFKYLDNGEEKWAQKFEEHYQQAKVAFEQAIPGFADPTQHQSIQEVAEAVTAYYQGFNQIHDKYIQQQQIKNDQLDVLGPRARELGSQIFESVIADFNKANDTTKTTVIHTRSWLLITIGIAIMVSLILGWLISRGIMRQLGGEPALVAEMAKKIASGDLSTQFESKQQPTGLFASMLDMQTQLRERIQELNKTQHQLQERIEEEQRTAESALRVNRALEKATTSVMITDVDYNIIYLNESAHCLFKTEENKIRQDLPHFDANQLLGKNLDTFHKNPTYQRQILAQLADTRRARVTIGELTLDHIITPVFNKNGERLGIVIEFNNRTLEIATEQEINAVIHAASQSDFQQRIDLEGKTGFFYTFSEGINQVLNFNQLAIEDIMRILTALAQGDLTQQIENNYRGAFEQLKNDINATIEKLTEMVAVIAQSAAVVNDAAEELSQGNINLSQRTEQQAASLEETAASMEQMTSTVQQNADNAQQASQLALSATEQAVRGGKVVNAAIKAIIEINKSSQKITDIIGVIDEIAFQTNLLALNAAVESARAGEQGRGFAVVAAEVRNLAQRSAEAAKEIKSLIKDSVTKVEEGTQLANQSGESLEAIVISVKKVNDIISEMAAASKEQSGGIQQINTAITQMDEMTQKNAALVGEAIAASDAMREQAQMLKEQVMLFKIERQLEQPQSKKTKAIINRPNLVYKTQTISEPLPDDADDDEGEWQDF
ncbi:methyl-accepting chemotaxis protein [Thioploca ingrica]|uniref:Methyl-accepting chemotaxis protein n=1 Tax=Thioploca ingrica TaxID=40754 RepID=A0A090AIL5_9GAMM|nr:methyl-accepting chemotaxis protein [Thioploca ingrica]